MLGSMIMALLVAGDFERGLVRSASKVREHVQSSWRKMRHEEMVRT